MGLHEDDEHMLKLAMVMLSAKHHRTYADDPGGRTAENWAVWYARVHSDEFRAFCEEHDVSVYLCEYEHSSEVQVHKRRICRHCDMHLSAHVNGVCLFSPSTLFSERDPPQTSDTESVTQIV